MEIIELIVAGAQLCDCFVGLLSLTSATGGAIEARRGAGNRRERKLAKQAGQQPPPVSRDNWLALLLFLMAGILLVVLAVTWMVSRS